VVDNGNDAARALESWAASAIPKAVAYARSLLDRPGDAEDVVHDVLVRLLDHPEYDLVRHGEPLLFRSITHACINRWQRRRPMLSLDGMSPDAEGRRNGFAPAAPDPDPVQLAEAGELEEAIGRSLASLPVLQRAALELKALGHDLQSIADALNITPNHAGVLVHRARHHVAARIAPHWKGKVS